MAKEAFFVNIIFQEKDLRKFKCHSGRESLPWTVVVEDGNLSNYPFFKPDEARACQRI